MVKQLLVIRHAKSSWDFSGQPDFERALNERGLRDAPEMASRLLKKQVRIEAFLSSTANRAFTTAAFFAKAYGLPESAIRGYRQLYHAQPAVYYALIKELEDNVTTAAFFAHNPGITSFVNELTNARIDNMPTCSIFAVKANCDNWKDFRKAEKRLWFFDYPKATQE